MSEMPEDIVCLVLKSCNEGLTNDEEIQLDEWLQTHPEAEEEMQRLKRYAMAGREMRIFEQIDMEKAWQRVDRQTEKTVGWKRRRKMTPYWWGAAAVVVLVIAGMFWINRSQAPVGDELIASYESFKPGSQKAIWELPGGRFIELEKGGERLLMGSDGNVIGRDSANTLILRGEGNGVTEQTVVRVPQGGEYSVILADGTKVWINSESELSFPSVFTGKERVVEVKGEAYFEVTKDADHPFVVKMGESAIRVLGTSFNACGYSEDSYEQITLVSGSVEVDYRGKQYKLIPGEQLEAISDGGEPNVKKVDVRLFASWKDGMFRFKDMPLDELVVKLKRWYDVNFVFENENCKTYRFTGAIKKDVDFHEFIQLIETTTNVRFDISEDKIVIREK